MGSHEQTDAGAPAAEIRDWLVFGLPFAAAAVACLILLPRGHHLDAVPASIGVLLFFISGQMELRLPIGWVSGQQAAFVLMLFAVPLDAVPTLVCVCLVADGLSKRRFRLLPRCACDSWFALPPALVVALAAPGPPRWTYWPIYAAAFGAQFAADAGVNALRDRLQAQPVLIGSTLAAFGVDAMLTPVGLMAAVNARSAPAATAAMLLGATALLALLSYERGERIAQTSRALHDPLTGLANRALFSEFLAFTEDQCRRRGTEAGLVLLDLDDFKQINDLHGHAVGDEVLCLVAERLRASTRGSDVCARLGGDEFAFVLAEPTGRDQAATVADKLRRALTEPLVLRSGAGLHLRSSIGVATFGQTTPAVQALAAADGDLYADKRARKCA